MKRKLLLSGIFASASVTLFASAAYSASSDAVPAVYLSTVTVSAQKQSDVVRTISRDQIVTSYAPSLEAVFSLMPSFSCAQRGTSGGQSDVTFRGSTFEQVALYVDGIPVANRQTGHHLLDIPVSLDDVERVEQTNQGFAGTFNIVTKKKNIPRASLMFGSHDFYRASAGVPIDTGKVQHYMSFDKEKSSGYMTDTDFDTTRISLGESYTNETSSIKTSVGYMRKDFGANMFYGPAASREQTESWLATVHATHALDEQYTLVPTLYYKKYDDTFVYNPVASSSANNHTTRGYGMGCAVQTQYGNHDISYGIDTGWDDIASTNLNNHYETNVRGYAEASGEVPVFSTLHYTARVRNTMYSAYPAACAPSVYVRGALTNHTAWHAGINKDYRIPSFTELYYVSKTDIGTSSLRPEEAWNYECGASLDTSRVKAQSTVFLRDETNVIDWGKRNGARVWRTENISRITVSGIEADVTYSPMQRVTTQCAYTYTDEETKVDASYTSKYKLNYLKHQLVGSVDVTMLRDVTVRATATYKDRMHYGDYGYVDAVVSKPIAQGTLVLKINNIFNEQYAEVGTVTPPIVTIVPMPGRWIYLGYEIKI